MHFVSPNNINFPLYYAILEIVCFAASWYCPVILDCSSIVISNKANTYIDNTRGKIAIFLEAGRLPDMSCLLLRILLAVARRKLRFTPPQLVQSPGAPSCSVGWVHIVWHCFHMSQNMYGRGRIAEKFVHKRERGEDAFFYWTVSCVPVICLLRIQR